jgi:single-strand DNA-binding protein
MLNVNRVFVAGTLTTEPELRRTKTGFTVTTVILRVIREWEDKEGQNKVEQSDIEVDVFGKAAENLCQYLKKDDPVMFTGHLKLETWTDRQSGEACARMIVVAEQMTFIPTENGGGGGNRRAQSQGARPE